MVEPDDDMLETSGEASIMYMVCDDVVSAKMYVQYTIDPDFEFALRRLYKAGICIGIKTFDPNVAPHYSLLLRIPHFPDYHKRV